MKHITLYLPFLISYSLLAEPEAAFWSAWAGSVLLIILVFSGIIKPKEEYGSWIDVPLKPLYFPHLIFITTTGVGSIFFFLSSKGYVYWQLENAPLLEGEIFSIAKAQVLYSLAHAGLLHGILSFSQVRNSATIIRSSSLAKICIRIVVFVSLFNFFLNFMPQYAQVTARTTALVLVTSSALLVLSIKEGRTTIFYFSLLFIGINLANAVLSGWKENIILPFLFLFLFFLPLYRFKIIFVAIPFFVLLLFLLPTFNGVIRKLVWEGGQDQNASFRLAIESLQDQKKVKEENWDFLVNRISDIGMFTRYVSNVPTRVPYMGIIIIEQGVSGLFPRILNPSKASLEETVMKRVRDNGIVEWYSTQVSAKPQIITDGYLSFGFIGVWLFGFLMGTAEAKISSLAENLFGGYFFGTGLIFSSLFNIFWKGNCFEFLLNNVFWSIVIMYLIYLILLMTGTLIPKTKTKNHG